MNTFKIYLVAIIVLFSCLKSKSDKGSRNIKQTVFNEYKITKIETIDSVYSIYAVKQDTIFRILSSKKFDGECKSIKVGEVYNLKIKPLINYDAPYLVEVDAVVFNGIEFYFDSIPNLKLYKAENLDGLCLNDSDGSVPN